MDFSTVTFTAQILPMTARINACNGCMFSNEKVAVCKQIAILAKNSGLPDCDDEPAGKRIVYVLPETDLRQLDIFQGID